MILFKTDEMRKKWDSSLIIKKFRAKRISEEILHLLLFMSTALKARRPRDHKAPSVLARTVA